jgi:hypothetical protein
LKNHALLEHDLNLINGQRLNQLSWAVNLSYWNGCGVVVELQVLVVVALEAGAAPGGGGQNDGRRVHRVRALIPACLHHSPLSLSSYLPSYLVYDGPEAESLASWIEFHARRPN